MPGRRRTEIVLLEAESVAFPDPSFALEDPNGLLAAGGDLTADWLLTAYAEGIFPWFNDDRGPVLWWSPDPRAVLRPDQLDVSRSLAKRIRNGGFHVTMDEVFADVVAGCAAPRRDGEGTWITPRMRQAYLELHRLGYAHSVEVWQDGELAGGLYGVSLGRMFFGESMFSRIRDASKVALYHLARQLERWGFTLIDCQVMNEHLRSLGVREMPRCEFLEGVRGNDLRATRRGPWRLEITDAG
jgi:leucyl/phenylalanyl-tRNA--protein transferase